MTNALLALLGTLREDQAPLSAGVNGFHPSGREVSGDLRERLVQRVGGVLAERIVEVGDVGLAVAVVSGSNGEGVI